MPIPKPHKDESKSDFMSRCMGDSVMTSEYEEKQRYKICLKQWEEERADESYEERTENEHECRLRDPAAFKKGSFRSYDREHDGKTYSIIAGRIKGRTKMTEQAYRYGDEEWDADEAKTHCKDHDGTFTAATGEAEGGRAMDEGEARGAISSHKTGTTTKSWDGPANEARLKKDQNEAYYKKAYAWRDPEGDPKKKATYKFIHHEVSADGTPGNANISGCQNGIGVLNGGRGGTTIPDADRKGVWNHLAAHLRSAEVEPAELKAAFEEGGKEERVYAADLVELRVVRSATTPAKIVGYAAVFDSISEELFGFREKVAPGAFKKSLKGSDARALFNHDVNYVLGRESSGTLRLKEDAKGLWMEVTPPDTQIIRDLVLAPIERRDITQQSFGFTVRRDAWENMGTDSNELPLRTIVEVGRIFDVSPVTFPAYPDTQVALRSLDSAREGVEIPSDDVTGDGKNGGDSGDGDRTAADAGYDKHETPEKVETWARAQIGGK